MRKTTAFLTILATSLISYGALAQDDAAPPPAAAPEAAPPPAATPEAAPAPAPDPAAAPAAAPAAGGEAYTARSLTLSAGTFQATVPIVLNLSKERVLKPVFVPLDLRYGVTNELEVFLGHSGVMNGFMTAAGGVCLGGKDRGCAKFYDNLDIGGQYSFMKNNGLELSGLLALDIWHLSDPMMLAVDVGLGFKYTSAPIAIKAAPQVLIGANKRDAGNIKQGILLPVQVAFQATPELAVYLDTGIAGPTDHFGDLYVVPVGIGASYLVQHGLDVGAELMLPRVMTGISGDKAFDARMLTIFAAYRTN